MRRLLTPRWLVLHVTAVVLVVVFLRLGWWQLGRGEAGNTLSWGYTAEWPFFALCVVFMWFRMAEHEVYPDGRPSRRDRRRGRPAGTSADQPEPQPGAATAAPGAPADRQAPPEPPRRPPKRVMPTYVPGSEEDPDLAAYNDYLSRLNARSR